jgi:hypothetical protein
MFDISLDFLDHMFSKGKVDENQKVIPTKYEGKTYSKDQIFIVGFILLLIIVYISIIIKKYLAKKYKKKYEKQNRIELQTLRNPKSSGTMFIA